MGMADNLVAGETIVFESKKHWIAPVRDSIWPALMILGAYLIGVISPARETGLLGLVTNLLDLIRIGLLLCGIGWIVYNVIVWRTAEFALTDRRVSRDEGLLTRRSSATLLTSVSDVKLNVGFIGKALGFGDLVIFTASGEAGADRFRTISHAGEFRDAIMTQKVQAESSLRPPAATTQVPGPAPAQPSPPPAAGPSSADAADTLARLADLRDRGAITAEEYESKKAEILARM